MVQVKTASGVFWTDKKLNEMTRKSTRRKKKTTKASGAHFLTFPCDEARSVLEEILKEFTRIPFYRRKKLLFSRSRHSCSPVLIEVSVSLAWDPSISGRNL